MLLGRWPFFYVASAMQMVLCLFFVFFLAPAMQMAVLLFVGFLSTPFLVILCVYSFSFLFTPSFFHSGRRAAGGGRRVALKHGS